MTSDEMKKKGNLGIEAKPNGPAPVITPQDEARLDRALSAYTNPQPTPHETWLGNVMAALAEQGKGAIQAVRDMEPIGQGALPAFLRQGAKELSQVVPAFPDSVQVVEEVGGIWGANLTPQEVLEQKRPEPEMER